MLERFTLLPEHELPVHCLKHTFNVDCTFVFLCQSHKKLNFESLKILMEEDVISENFAKKISNAGLCFHHLD